ncbi:MAG: methyltransferase domain-containing protein [Acidimicrobiales bacterium]
MAEHETGQVDTGAAEVYDEFFVPALFGRFSDDIARMADIGPLDDVVDVACGTGALTRAIRARTSGRVVGVDLNPAMLAVASRADDGIEFEQADALALPFEDGAFDLATSQFGLMFVEDPAGGAREMARVARRGVIAVWGGIGDSEGYSAMQDLFRDELGDDAAASLDAPFAMGAPGVLERVVEAAGIDTPEFATVTGTGRFDSIDQWVTTEVRGWTLGDDVSPERLEQLIEAARVRLAAFGTDEGCVFGMTARVASWGA